MSERRTEFSDFSLHFIFTPLITRNRLIIIVSSLSVWRWFDFFFFFYDALNENAKFSTIAKILRFKIDVKCDKSWFKSTPYNWQYPVTPWSQCTFYGFCVSAKTFLNWKTFFKFFFFIVIKRRHSTEASRKMQEKKKRRILKNVIKWRWCDGNCCSFYF